mmetsp:Transcript_106462/g.159243  ORF Transcript_106462/g.159243 Transcript_106462/m.159243 type:complete len:275 (-) Transcript_106462:104-928(-)|eukprot:CAMPEP_0117024688 /NCGR_PEP_ID=MMETSP0472-20121206/18309_1 /TAXON_ID=693140 ORGANISM="Tiarina fusus, Strain LIS" /NCGR_SAMPLE_ID=MMETSP0472 /ASSEMBLY_ACC=CAM_ASM_000603 /LENGTH=274 /DNA_ID=CAMNT_0004731189 /DNA_START=116 /DNA_END=940 /DNA_ORIENTATION=+
MPLWDSIKAKAAQAGDATKLAAHKTKLRTDMMMIDREITNRQRAFGVSMYDHVSPLSQSSDFYAATDDLTNILRPPLINAQKEIQALAAKRVQLKESLAAAEAKRAGAFPEKADTVGKKVMNFGKAGVMHSGETKIKAELAIVDRQIKSHKQKFGLELYGTLAEAEDTRGYLPSDRQVRSIYDQTRQDIQAMQAKKKLKEEELISIGGTIHHDNNDTTGNDNQQQQQHQLHHQQQGGGGGYSDNAGPTTTGGYSDVPAASPSNAHDGEMEDMLL